MTLWFHTHVIDVIVAGSETTILNWCWLLIRCEKCFSSKMITWKTVQLWGEITLCQQCSSLLRSELYTHTPNGYCPKSVDFFHPLRIVSDCAGTLPTWNKKHCLKCCCPDCISELCYYYKLVLFIMSTIISTNLIREAIAILETSLQTDTTLHLSVILSEHIYSLHCAFFISF